MASFANQRLPIAATAALVGICVLGASRVARAGDSAAADLLFREGRQAARAGDHKTACAKFHESYKLEPTVGTAFNLGDCEEHLGRVATAWGFFKQVVERLPPGDDRISFAKKRADALKPRIPTLAIRYAGEQVPGLTIKRNGTELGSASLGRPLPLDPGTYVIAVTAEGFARGETKIELKEKQHETVEARLGPKQSKAPPPNGTKPGKGPAPQNAEGDPGPPTLAYVAGGIGVAGLLFGGATGVMALSKKGEVDDNCSATTKKCNSTGFAAAEDGAQLGTMSTVGFVVGAVGLSVGAYLLLSPKESGPAQTALMPSISQKSQGFSLVHIW